MSIAVAGPAAASPDSIGVPVRSKSFAGPLGDDLEISPPCRAVRVGTGGALKVRWANGSVDDVLPAIADGETVQGQIDKIYLTGTTAQNITVFW